MVRWVWCLVLGLTLLSRVSAEVSVPFEATVLKPDGTPAVGAAVLVRVLNESDGSLREDRQLTTDAMGHVVTAVTFETKPSPMLPLMYALIDVPGYALVLMPIIGNGRGMPGQRQVLEKITLRPLYAISGMLVGPNKQPVPGAEVTVVTSGSGSPPSRFNYPSANISTPALCTVTDKDGRFALRGVVGDTPGYHGGLFVVAVIAKQGDTVLVGDADLNYDLLPERLTERTITLVETTSLHGTVVDATKGQPIQGAQVSLVPRPGAFNRQALFLMMATSDVNGRYAFPGVPAIDELVVQATTPGYGNGWVKVNGDGSGRATPIDSTQDYRISLRPLVIVSGKVSDVATTRPIGALPLSLIATYDQGYKGFNLSTSSQTCETPVAADGSFTLRAPAGSCTFRLALDRTLRSTGWMSNSITGNFAHFTLKPGQAELTAGTSLALSVQRPDVLFLHLHSASEMADKAVVILRVNDKEVSYYPVNGYFALPATPGTSLTYRVECEKKEVLPWSDLVVDKNRWVQEVAIP